jgi:hypothetical protein
MLIEKYPAKKIYFSCLDKIWAIFVESCSTKIATILYAQLKKFFQPDKI